MWYFGIKLFALILILSVSYAFPSGGSIGLTITGSTSREQSIVAPLANVGDNVDTKIKQLVNLKVSIKIRAYRSMSYNYTLFCFC